MSHDSLYIEDDESNIAVVEAIVVTSLERAAPGQVRP